MIDQEVEEPVEYIKYVFQSYSLRSGQVFFYINKKLKDIISESIADGYYDKWILWKRADFSFTQEVSKAVKDREFGSLEKRYDSLLGITKQNIVYVRECIGGKLVEVKYND